MKKNLAISLGVVALLLVAVGGYLAFSKSKSPAGEAPSVVGDNPVNQPAEKKTLKDLFSLGSSQKCSFTDAVSGSTGTVYVAGGEARTEFTFRSPDGSVQTSHMISKNDQAYMWTEGETQGYTISLKDESSEDATTGDTTAPGPELDSEVDYTCENWSADAGYFALPAGVTFTDLSALMETVPAVGEETLPREIDEGEEAPAGACTTCESLPAEAQVQCRQAMGCE